MPRQARIDFPGALHHVIVRGIEGKYIFKETLDKEELCARLKKMLDKSSMQIYAWCIMSNHFHLLIQTGKTSLSEFMRSLLTGYAVNYNRRYKRKGYLFQNRYKSIVCDKDEYLLPLIRYIHLNPVKAKMINYTRLKIYEWTGHSRIIKAGKKSLINRDEVLGYFGKTEKGAVEGYGQYVKKGIDLKDDYSGGGLIRSLGGFGAALGLDVGGREMGDERILGNGEFVESVLDQLEKEEELIRYFKNKAAFLGRRSC